MLKHHNNSDLVYALKDSLEGKVETIEITDRSPNIGKDIHKKANIFQFLEGYRFEHLKMSLDDLSFEYG